MDEASNMVGTVLSMSHCDQEKLGLSHLPDGCGQTPESEGTLCGSPCASGCLK